MTEYPDGHRERGMKGGDREKERNTRKQKCEAFE